MKLFLSFRTVAFLVASLACALLQPVHGHHFWLAVMDAEKGEYEITFSEQPFAPEATIGHLKDVIEKSLVVNAVVWEKNGGDGGRGKRKIVLLEGWELQDDKIVGSIPQDILEKRPMISGSIDRGPFKREVDADDILFYFSSEQLGGAGHHRRGYYHGGNHHHADNLITDVESSSGGGYLRSAHHHGWNGHKGMHGHAGADDEHSAPFHVSTGNCGGDVHVGVRGLPRAGGEETLVDDTIQVCMYEVGSKNKLACEDLKIVDDKKSGRNMAVGKIDLSSLVVSPATLFATAKMAITRPSSSDDDYTDNETEKVLKIASTSVDYTPACSEYSVSGSSSTH